MTGLLWQLEGWLERSTQATLVVAQAATKDNKEPVARKPFYREKIVFHPNSNSSERSLSTFPTGQYTWPFQFRIPKQYKPLHARTFHLEYHRRTLFDLPPTFVERMPYILQFAVVAEVKRGFMKLDNMWVFFSVLWYAFIILSQLTLHLLSALSLRAPFRHVPISIPDTPASPLRLDAYEHNLSLPPPDLDPDGYSTTSVSLSGSLNGSPFSLACHVGEMS